MDNAIILNTFWLHIPKLDKTSNKLIYLYVTYITMFIVFRKHLFDFSVFQSSKNIPSVHNFGDFVNRSKAEMMQRVKSRIKTWYFYVFFLSASAKINFRNDISSYHVRDIQRYLSILLFGIVLRWTLRYRWQHTIV